MPQGSLFTEDFLNEGILETEPWRACPATAMASLRPVLHGM